VVWLLAAIAGGLALALAIVAPVVAAGRPNMLQALGASRPDMLSANAMNLWWVIGYLRACATRCTTWGSGGSHRAGENPRHPARDRDGYPDPRAIGIALTIIAIAWAA
jgi:hypothetical protein